MPTATKLWVLSDQHLFHGAMTERGHRPRGYEDTIYENWKRLVGADDIVIDLGDVILGKNSTLTERMQSLPGRKVMVRGNHDARPTFFLGHGYDFACDYFLFRSICFSHKPMIPLPPRTKINVHGHFHDSQHRSSWFETHPYFAAHRERYRLVEIETTLAPVPLESVVTWEELKGIEQLTPQEDPELIAERKTERQYREREYQRITTERGGSDVPY